MYKSTLVTLALTSIASAQSTTSLYLFELPREGVVASVIKSDSAAVATYSLACADGYEDDCYLPPSFLMTQGPSTIHINYQTSTFVEGVSATASVDLGCSITNSKNGTCSKTLVRNIGSSKTSTAATTSFTDAAGDLNFTPVTLSAGGIGSSAVATATETKSGLTTKTGTSATSAVTGSLVGSSGASSTSSSASVVSTSSASSSASGSSSAGAASSSTASTAGMPMITGNAQWVIGGAAAAIALAVM